VTLPEGIRPPAVAGLFYPSDRVDCLRELERCRAAASARIPAGRRAVAAVAPHAGWTYSGVPAAEALAALEPADPDTVLLFGADHHGLHRGRASVWTGRAWRTPVGDVPVDGETAVALAADPSAGVDAVPGAHGPEHSLEVLVPFLVDRFPRARIVPVLTPPGTGAAAAGTAAVRAARRLGRSAVAVGSSDLTHYGESYGFTPRGEGPSAHRWSKEVNDRDVLDRVLALDPDGVEASARRCRNACGPGAMAAAVAAARELGAREGVLLRHTTSAEVRGERDPETWVGYAAVAFLL
jgi:AmmeMemoRadiSam system protein B